MKRKKTGRRRAQKRRFCPGDHVRVASGTVVFPYLELDVGMRLGWTALKGHPCRWYAEGIHGIIVSAPSWRSSMVMFAHDIGWVYNEHLAWVEQR